MHIHAKIKITILKSRWNSNNTDNIKLFNNGEKFWFFFFQKPKKWTINGWRTKQTKQRKKINKQIMLVVFNCLTFQEGTSFSLELSSLGAVVTWSLQGWTQVCAQLSTCSLCLVLHCFRLFSLGSFFKQSVAPLLLHEWCENSMKPLLGITMRG